MHFPEQTYSLLFHHLHFYLSLGVLLFYVESVLRGLRVLACVFHVRLVRKSESKALNRLSLSIRYFCHASCLFHFHDIRPSFLVLRSSSHQSEQSLLLKPLTLCQHRRPLRRPCLNHNRPPPRHHQNAPPDLHLPCHHPSPRLLPPYSPPSPRHRRAPPPRPLPRSNA